MLKTSTWAAAHLGSLASSPGFQWAGHCRRARERRAWRRPGGEVSRPWRTEGGKSDGQSGRGATLTPAHQGTIGLAQGHSQLRRPAPPSARKPCYGPTDCAGRPPQHHLANTSTPPHQHIGTSAHRHSLHPKQRKTGTHTAAPAGPGATDHGPTAVPRNSVTVEGDPPL